MEDIEKRYNFIVRFYGSIHSVSGNLHILLILSCSSSFFHLKLRTNCVNMHKEVAWCVRKKFQIKFNCGNVFFRLSIKTVLSNDLVCATTAAAVAIVLWIIRSNNNSTCLFAFVQLKWNLFTSLYSTQLTRLSKQFNMLYIRMFVKLFCVLYIKHATAQWRCLNRKNSLEISEIWRTFSRHRKNYYYLVFLSHHIDLFCCLLLFCNLWLMAYE